MLISPPVATVSGFAGSEVQEFDGMAYLSSPFIAARRTGDPDSDEEDSVAGKPSTAQKSVPTPKN